MNELLDAATTRDASAKQHLPVPMLALLAALAGLAALLAGRSIASSQRQSKAHGLILVVAFAAVLTVLIDLEYPRLGWIGIGASDDAMTSLAQTIENDASR